MSKKRISMAAIRRYQRETIRFMNAVEEAYPGLAADLAYAGDAKRETIRNAATVEAYISRWIYHRELHRKDPYEE
jgi:hypothetical protein